MDHDLTSGKITVKLLKFAFPLMLGNVLQQLYNVIDTIIVGKVLGADALAAVGASYTLMTFLTSILIGLCMGSSAYFAIQFGKKDYENLNKGIFQSFLLIGVLTAALNVFVFTAIPWSGSDFTGARGTSALDEGVSGIYFCRYHGNLSL